MDGRKEIVTGTETGAGTGMKTRAGTSTRVGMGARTGARKGMRIEMRVEGSESGGTYKKRIEVDRKTREGGRRQRVISNHSRKDPMPQRDRRIILRTRTQGRERDIIGEGREEAKKRKKRHKSCRRHVENGGDSGGRRKNVGKKVLHVLVK